MAPSSDMRHCTTHMPPTRRRCRRGNGVARPRLSCHPMSSGSIQALLGLAAPQSNARTVQIQAALWPRPPQPRDTDVCVCSSPPSASRIRKNFSAQNEEGADNIPATHFLHAEPLREGFVRRGNAIGVALVAVLLGRGRSCAPGGGVGASNPNRARGTYQAGHRALRPLIPCAGAGGTRPAASSSSPPPSCILGRVLPLSPFEATGGTTLAKLIIVLNGLRTIRVSLHRESGTGITIERRKDWYYCK